MNHFPQGEEKPGLVERYATTIKLFFVAMLTLMLLIPLAMIQSLIGERQNTRQEVVREITSKWGGEQTITGPCLVIPYEEIRVEEKREIVERRNLLLLPETLDAKISTSVEERRRGIYDASVYRSNILLTGEFDISVIARQNLNPSQVKWNDVRMIIGLSDLKGIQEQVSLEQDGEVTIFEPGIPVENLEPGRGSASDNMLYELFSVGLNAKPAFPTPDSALQEIYPFSVAMRLNGSRGIYVVPAGKTTTASIQSDWTTPSFDGEFLPQTREISDKGFVAEWRVLDLNRSFGQVIRSDNSNTLNQMAASRFGVRFIQAVDQYRQNMRSVKYGILVLLLTFVAVLFIELMRKRRINPFQYLLVGLALLLFYTLLLSMSELLGFNLAYLIAAVMTTLLISLHMGSILGSQRQGVQIGVLLLFLYLFLFLLIQMESYALLAGSLGLFVILAVIMYYSKQLR
ncbi:Inner membrane protein CreD [Petrimonas mucosa]|uniref:Inner membrane protein CreD n=4 Tax=Petrimonas mucosa TaxID=1642646 RepID=A0A1G4GBB1_9BACT|nr:Inner membrane protein CreD [Petrimonas mucosa]SFU59914.1 inner membrane protein [Porphyromonadaceae bacterium KHP3R9]